MNCQLTSDGLMCKWSPHRKKWGKLNGILDTHLHTHVYSYVCILRTLYKEIHLCVIYIHVSVYQYMICNI